MSVDLGIRLAINRDFASFARNGEEDCVVLDPPGPAPVGSARFARAVKLTYSPLLGMVSGFLSERASSTLATG